MADSSSTSDRGGVFDNTNNDTKTKADLELRFNELTTLSQELLTEKLFLENECAQLKKRVNRLDDEIRTLKEPPFIVGNVQDIIGNEAIVRSSNGTIFQVSINPRLEIDLLKPGTRVALNQDTLAIIDVLTDGWDPLVSASEVVEKPSTTFAEIGGVDAQIASLKQAIELPLMKPEAFRKMGLDPPKGVLLTGPPGTGKTMLARAVANSTSATFLGMVGSELAQKYIGEGGRMVRELFDLARDKSPAIIFIDEIDAIGSKRLDSSTSGDREVQRTLMQLLAEMDGFDSLDDVKLIAATNRPELLDKALLRPGRFDRIIEVDLPDSEGRLAILEILTRNTPMSESVNLQTLSRNTDGYSGAELKSLIMEAGMIAIEADSNKLTQSHVNASLSIIEKARKDPIRANHEGLYG
tara:strand:- start:4765 stop:5994 length:1230 start_codon:yes stop_codon:yes gene_type:complete